MLFQFFCQVFEVIGWMNHDIPSAINFEHKKMYKISHY